MRKGINIKASLIIISWLMIMAHNIIPHNHQVCDFSLIHRHFHDGKSLQDEFHNHGDDHGICRISGLLFYHLIQDNLFIENCNNDYSFSEVQKELIIDNNKHSLYRNSFYASVSLRAPPAA